MTYQEAQQYLEGFVNYEMLASYDYNSSFMLDRMKRLAGFLGDPQESIKSIHIAGSKGKGSTSAFIYSILKSAGYKAGLYTSPHLVTFRERIRVNDSLISPERMAALTEKIREAVLQMGGESPTFFELCTALAFLYFKEENVDFAVYEVGLGGRLDATNIIDPLVSVITPISYEHTDKLGNTLSQIAFEKGGIIKEGGILILAPQEDEARKVIEDLCRKRNSRLMAVGKDIRFEEVSASDDLEVFSVFGNFCEYITLETRLLGSHQVANAAAAIGAIEALRYSGINIGQQAVRNGIRSAQWDGRLEIVARKPYIILDGAQNRASARAIAESVKRLFRFDRLILILGVSKDKDLAGMLEEIMPITTSVISTRSKVADRALDPGLIRDGVTPFNKDVIVTGSVEEALDAAGRMARPEDLVLVTGSLFVVGEARKKLIGL